MAHTWQLHSRNWFNRCGTSSVSTDDTKMPLVLHVRDELSMFVTHGLHKFHWWTLMDTDGHRWTPTDNLLSARRFAVWINCISQLWDVCLFELCEITLSSLFNIALSVALNLNIWLCYLCPSPDTQCMSLWTFTNITCLTMRHTSFWLKTEWSNNATYQLDVISSETRSLCQIEDWWL